VRVPARSAPRWILLVYLLCLTGFYVDTELTPNSGSRVCTTLELLLTGSPVIDDFAEYTQDKSFVGGHYYSDKAPLPSLLFALPEWIMETASPSRSLKVRFERALGLSGFLFAAVPLALFGLWLAIDGLPLPMTVLAICGTFVWVYAGAFFGHIFAGFLVVCAHRCTFRHGRPFLGGLVLAAAFLSEFPTALAAPAFALALVSQTRFGPDWWLRFKAAALGPVLRLAAGFLALAWVILPYNAAITGDPFTMVYSYVSTPDFAPMRTDLGFRWFSMGEGLWGLLFSGSRGLFLFAPIFLLVFVRGKSWLAALRAAAPFPASVVFFVASVLMFSAYYMWNGGGAYGPRHLIPATMLLIYDVAPIVARESRYSRPWRRWTVVLVLAVLGVLPALAAKLTVRYLLPPWVNWPLTDVVLPALLEGRWNHTGLTSLLLGWSPGASLLFFLGIAVLGGVWLGRRSASPHLV
jgi:hypothetical protein